jgi:hypothetical protein
VIGPAAGGHGRIDLGWRVTAAWLALRVRLVDLFRRRRSRPDIRVSATVGIPKCAPDGLPRVTIIAANRDAWPITIAGSGLLVANAIGVRFGTTPNLFWRRVHWSDDEPIDPRLVVPHLIEAGWTSSDLRNLRAVSRDLETIGRSDRLRVCGYVSDARNRLYLSPPFALDLDHWRPYWEGRPIPDPAFDPSQPETAPSIARGIPIVAADGTVLGIVDSVWDDAVFLDRGSEGPDLRIPGHWVAGWDDEAVRLAADADALGLDPA